MAIGTAGVRSQRCMRMVSSRRGLGTVLVVVVIFVPLLVLLVVFLGRARLRRRGGHERVELLLRVVEDGAELGVKVAEDAVVRRAQRVDIERDTRVSVAV